MLRRWKLSHTDANDSKGELLAFFPTRPVLVDVCMDTRDSSGGSGNC